MTESSNHEHTKLVPLLVHDFLSQQVVKMKIEFTNLSREFYAQLIGYTVYVLEEAELISSVTFSM
jgi:hypothetical protein